MYIQNFISVPLTAAEISHNLGAAAGPWRSLERAIIIEYIILVYIQYFARILLTAEEMSYLKSTLVAAAKS